MEVYNTHKQVPHIPVMLSVNRRTLANQLLKYKLVLHKYIATFVILEQ